MNTNKILVCLGVLLVLVLGVTFPRNGGTVAERIVEKTVGGVSTLDGVDGSYVNINGVQTAYVSQPINATSTMLCNIKNPYTSTSTLLSLSVRVTSGILGANAYSVSTSSTYYGSSTPALVLNHNIPTGSTDSMQWFINSATTSPGVLPGVSPTGETFVKVKSGEYVVTRLATTTGAGALAAYYGGQCSAVFQRQ